MHCNLNEFMWNNFNRQYLFLKVANSVEISKKVNINSKQYKVNHYSRHAGRRVINTYTLLLQEGKKHASVSVNKEHQKYQIFWDL